MHNIYSMHTLNNLHTNQAAKTSKTIPSDFTGESSYFDGQWHSQKTFREKREGGAIASVTKNRVPLSKLIRSTDFESFRNRFLLSNRSVVHRHNIHNTHNTHNICVKEKYYGSYRQYNQSKRRGGKNQYHPHLGNRPVNVGETCSFY